MLPVISFPPPHFPTFASPDFFLFCFSAYAQPAVFSSPFPHYSLFPPGMPSFQSTFFRLSSQALRSGVRMDVDNIPQIRQLLEYSAIPLYLPAGVQTRSFRLAGMPAEWYLPRACDREHVLLYLHGGGYSAGSIATHRGLVGRLAQAAGVAALQIEYRLAPEHPFPAALQDAVHAYEWLLAQGYPPSRIIMAGDSAGGGLCMATQLALREMGKPLPAGTVLFSPWVDLTFSGDSARTYATTDPIVHVAEVAGWGRAYAGDYRITHPMISPLFADLQDLPPVLIQASDSEALTDDARRLHAKIQAIGGESTLALSPAMLHVWQLFWRYLPEAEQAVLSAAAFLQACYTRPAQRPAYRRAAGA
ncbi:MAG: alpha/beta hydrolase [Bacteroidetes bacterium]|nr:MAG: alpha/beta hydrolase [Bacteroidota bacterium]